VIKARTTLQTKSFSVITANRYGWNWALASMALGPLLGIWAMSGLIPRNQKMTA